MIDFVSEYIRFQWKSVRVNRRLRALVLAVATLLLSRYNAKLVITSIFRENDGIHGDWRACDIKISNFGSTEEIREAVEWINKTFIYDPARPRYKTAVYGDDKHLDHIHLQVLWGDDPVWIPSK